MLAFHKILVPVDGSPNSHRGLAYASYLAERCQASIGVLHVVKLSSEVAAISQASHGYVPDSVIADIQNRGQSVVSEAFNLLPPGIVAEGFVEVGAPTDAILAFCTTHDYDLIVIGSRGWGAIQQLVLGSVSSFVLHHAPCPVMVVK